MRVNIIILCVALISDICCLLIGKCLKMIFYLSSSLETEIRVANTHRVLKKQVGGSPCFSYGLRDMYNKLAQFECRTFDGGNANSLIEIFNRRLKYEDEFYIAFEINVNNCLVSFLGVIRKCWMTILHLEIWWCLTRHIVRINAI